jgi:long-chain acyl-CoA synthetase
MDLSSINNFQQFIRKVASVYEDEVVFEMRRRIVNRKIRFSQLPLLVNQLTNFFQERSIKKGDKILIQGTNSPEYSVLLLGIFASGRVAVPVDYRSSDEVLKKIVRLTKPTVFFSSRLFPNKILETKRNHFYLEDLFSTIKSYPSESKFKNINYKSKKKICEVIYTSGTTGEPKGVIFYEKNLLDNTKAILKLMPKLKEYRSISILPLSHMFEQVGGLLLGLSLGTKITYLTTVNSLRIREAIQEKKPTYLLIVPQILNIFWNRIEDQARTDNKYDLMEFMFRLSNTLPIPLRKLLFFKVHREFGNSLAWIGCAGAPLNYDVACNFSDMGFRVGELYGATECMAVTLNLDEKNFGTVGYPISKVKVKLDNDGQILVKSKFASGGYYKNPKRNRESFSNGWYKTGDVGRVDRYGGRLIILGRDDFKIVLSSGEKVYVEDLEKKINLHSSVKDSCVVGIRDGVADKVHAVFLLKSQKDKDISDLVEDINKDLEPHQQIMSYSLWREDDFPRTHTLKVDRKRVKEVVFQKTEERVTESVKQKNIMETMDLYGVISKVSEVDRSKLRKDQILTSDLGVDSLARGEIIALIEENLGFYIDELRIDEQTTISDLERIISQSPKKETGIKYIRWPFTWWGELLRLFAYQLLAFPIHSFFVKMKIVNRRNLSDVKPGSIIIYNHPGLFDGICIMRLLGKDVVKTLVPVYPGVWNRKIFGILTELGAGGIPLDQTGSRLVHLLRYISDLLEEGRYLIYAPQGTFLRSEGDEKFKAGIGLFAHELELPVIPIKIEGYEKIWIPPKEAVDKMKWNELFPKKRGVVKVKIGKKIDVSDMENPVVIRNYLQKEFKKL